MKLEFSWQRFDGELAPICKSDVLNEDGINLLCCLLADDGGVGHQSSIEWIEVGLMKMRSIRNAELDLADWSRETWGAEITPKQVKIYSLHNDEYFELIDSVSFELALNEWKLFLESTSAHGIVREVVLDRL